MENHANPQSQPSDSVADETTDRQAKPQPQQDRHAFDALRDAIRKGAEDARTAAEKSIPKVKSAAASVLYWTAYGASFAAVFQWTFAKGIAPESLKCGLRDGVKGGMDAAEKWIEKLKQRKENANGATQDQAGPSTDAIQPGLA
jgi:hypothetical protein